MNSDSRNPFESIESAQEYLALLVQAVSESQQAVVADIQSLAPDASSRHLDALNLIAYNLDKLSTHVKRSQRILNDLRTLDRLLRKHKAEVAA